MLDHRKSKGIPKKSTFTSLTMLKHLTVWITANCEMGIPAHITCLLRNLYAGQEATVRTGHGTKDWFKIKYVNVKDVYCHPAYLTSVQSTSCEMPGWMTHKLEPRLPGEIATISDI